MMAEWLSDNDGEVLGFGFGGFCQAQHCHSGVGTSDPCTCYFPRLSVCRCSIPEPWFLSVSGVCLSAAVCNNFF